jgi:hypothetical protein
LLLPILQRRLLLLCFCERRLGRRVGGSGRSGRWDKFVQARDLILGALGLALLGGLFAVEALERALDVGLMAAGCFMLLALEFGVFDVIFAELAPVFWLRVVSRF